MPTDEIPPAAGEHLTEDAAVLAALGEELPPRDGAHLRGCRVCRSEVEGWARVVRTARSADVVEPVPVPSGTWEGIAREVGIDPVAPRRTSRPAAPVAAADVPGAGSPVVVALPRRPARSRSRWLPVAAAVLVGLGLGVAGNRWLGDPAAPPAPAPARVVSSAALEPLTGGTGGSGTADVTETGGTRRLALRVSGVAPLAGGFLEAWLLDADGGLVSLGTLAGGGEGSTATVELPDDLDLTRFDVVDVSREPLDGDPGHSSDSVLRGTLDVGA